MNPEKENPTQENIRRWHDLGFIHLYSYMALKLMYDKTPYEQHKAAYFCLPQGFQERV